MKVRNIYQKQWLSLGIVLLLTVTINTLVLDYLFADSVSSELLLISNGLLILSLLILGSSGQILLKKAESLTALQLMDNQPTSKIFPLLSSVLQRNHDSLQ